MIGRRSIGFRLAVLFSVVLLASLASLGAALWLAIEYHLVAAVDGLLSDRAAGLERFAAGEFGNVLVLAPDNANRGEFRGRIEEVDTARRWLVMSGARVRLGAETELEGTLRAADLRTGLFGEVEVERDGPGSPWRATKVGVVTDLRSELRETLQEFAMAGPDGPSIQLRETGTGNIVLPPKLEGAWRPPVAWRTAPAAAVFSTVVTGSGPYRVMDRELTLAGGTYRLQAASSLAALAATRASMTRWIWRALPLALLISLAAGYLFSRVALRPLAAFSRLAARVTANRLSERLTVPATGDLVEGLARTFNGMLERLESSVSRLEQFTADASHELRSPVAVIRTTAELAVRQQRNADQLRADMREIHAEATRLSELIDDLLSLARADAGNAPSPAGTDRVDLGEIARSVVNQFAATAEPGRITCRVEASGCFVRGDGARLRRLLVNLVDNAVRHTPPDTEIEVVVSLAGDAPVMSVADNGPGIPESELPRLFDRFHRGDPSRNRSQGEGSGLGLAIARCIAHAHGAEIEVSSKVGEGSVFRVRFGGRLPGGTAQQEREENAVHES